MKQKLLSIVIITCNRKEELKKTIFSCIQNAGMSIEIIVVDNGSKDGTREMIQAMEEENKMVRGYYSSENLGVSGGRNKGLELASSDIILFIDDDAVVDEKKSLKFVSAYEYMEANPQIGALAFDIYDTVQNGYLLDSFEIGKNGSGNMLSYVGACHMLRRVQKDGFLYPDNLMYGAEERYAAIRYYDMGFRVEYFGEIKIIHNPSNKTRLSKIEIYRNVMINQYVIKCLLLPKTMYTVVTFNFLLRQIKRERFNIKQIRINCIEARERIKENINAKKTIKKETMKYLMHSYGKFTII